MAAQRPERPPARAQLRTGTLMEPTADTMSRILSENAAATSALEDQRQPRSVFVINLAIGATRINHGLGRRARGATVSPTVPDATFAWGFSVDGDRVAIITTIGVAQLAATVEIF